MQNWKQSITFAPNPKYMRKHYLIIFYLLITSLYAQKSTSPIGFTENKGQLIDQEGKSNKNVQFLLNTPGLNVQLRKSGFSYDVYETKKVSLTEKKSDFSTTNDSFTKEATSSDYSLAYQYHRIDIDFEHSNPSVQLIAEEKSTDYDNYYTIAHAPEGITGVYKYKKVTYQNIYNHIDVVFFIPKDASKAVEYNFIVKPGGRVSDIQMKFNGIKTELVDNKIKMDVRFGQMEETLPLSWIENGNSRKEITVGYQKIKDDVYGFSGEVNASDKTIVIDPVPIRLWGTYYGGDNFDIPSSIITDNAGNVYISGGTRSTFNIATAGSHQSNIIGMRNLFIAKLLPNSHRIWGTYMLADGGLNNSQSCRLALDSSDNLYIAGHELNNSNIGTTGTFQPTKNGFNDGYLVKMNSNGVKLWGTYFGGSSNESVSSLCIDNLDNIYIVGQTSSVNFGTTASAHQNSLVGTTDGYIIKFDGSGNRIWNTYYGGSGNENLVRIKYSPDGFLYAMGIQASQNNIATPGSYQPVTTATSGGMLIKFDLNGNRVWGTYLCDNSVLNDVSFKDNKLYITGSTTNTNLATPGTYFDTFQTPDPRSTFNAGTNAIVISFDTQLQQVTWGTYFIDAIGSIATNSLSDIFITGKTAINDGITTPDAYMPTKETVNSRNFIVKLNTSGQRVWGTYVGGVGPGGEQGGFLAIDTNNSIFLFGLTTSANGISTSGAHQETKLGTGNITTYITKFAECQTAINASSNSPVCFGQNIQFNASGGTNYSWTGPNGFTSTDQNPVIINANTLHGGQYFCTITGAGVCDSTFTVNVVVGDTTVPVPNIPNLPVITGDCNTAITTIPTATDNCVGLLNGTTTAPLNYIIPGNYTIVWTYNDGNGNISTQNQSVVITATALPAAVSPQQFCIQDNATLNTIVINGQNIQWYDALTGGNLLASNTLLQNGVTYYASQTINGCESARISVTITIQNTPPPTGNTSQSFCTSENATLNNIAIAGTNVKWYASSVSTQPLAITTLLVDNTTYYATQNINGCESVNRLAVTITLINTLNAQNHQVEFCDSQDNGNEIIDLSSYNTNLIANTTGNSFSYYKSVSGAQNQVAVEKINNFSTYSLRLGTETVYVRIDNVNTCHQIVTLQLTLFGNPTIPIQDIMPICEGSSITVDAGSGNDTYNWSTGATSQRITITAPGNYSVSVTQNHNSVNCSTLQSFTVVNSNIATIENIIISEWTTANNSITVLLTSNSQGDYVYSLDGVNYQSGNTFENLPSGQYTVYVKDKNGCGITDKDVLLLMYPKFFTPNGDGYNDYWQIDNSKAKANFKILIFDRLGKLLKNIDSHSTGWDGTFNGQPLPSTDYWFTFTMSNGKEYKGHFTLKR